MRSTARTKTTPTPTLPCGPCDCRGISEVYLRRLFLSVYGEKPSEYITNLRLNRAKELLKSKTCGVGEARFKRFRRRLPLLATF
ncbi:MAG: helix-turn-helix domain-containing protein [Christensenellales bacterium]